MADRPLRVLFVGVGGQGLLTAAGLLGKAALDAGIGVHVGQLHGMSQRGGSVEATVVLGPSAGGFIGVGQADLLVGLEPLEAVRAIPRLAPESLVLLSPSRVVPHLLTHRGEPYPELDSLVARLEAVSRVVSFDGAALAQEAGNPRALNTVLLGALAATGRLPFSADILARTLETESPPRFRETNRRAFELGQGAFAKVGAA